MGEAEKMVALKTAYAEILLNTAKEAAARIMVSERNAIRLERELGAAKEESINVLVRVKEMMDSKCAEAEKASLNQRKRIEELEAQLNEAEDMITDIRAELKEVQDELAKMKNNQVKPLDEQIVNKSFASNKNGQNEEGKVIDLKEQLRVAKMENSQVKPLDDRPVNVSTGSHADASPSGCVLLKPVDSGATPLSKFDMKDVPLSNGKAIECCRFKSHNTSPQSGFLSDSPGEIHYAGKSDLASVIMRSKEHDMYQNGCTQKRIHANLRLQGEINNQYMAESLIREDEAAEGLCNLAPHKEDSMRTRIQSRMETLSQHGVSSDKGRAVKLCTRFSNRKRRRRYRRTKTILSTNNVKSSRETSIPSSCETYSCMDTTSIVKSSDSPARTIEEAYIKSESHHAPLSSMNTIKDDPFSGHMNGNGPDCRIAKLGSFESSPNEGIDLIDKSVLIGQKRRDVENSRASVCTLNPKTDLVALVTPNSEDCLKCEMANEAPTQSVNDKFLKYTFRRKRKKRSLSSADENVSPERNASNRLLDVKQRVGAEPKKSSLLIKSSRESRRLMQVARQLISLSGKRHWR